MRWIVLVWFALSTPALGAAGHSTRTGKVFRVICHFESEDIANEALRTAEMVWPEATNLLCVDQGAPAETREIHVYRTAAEYRKVDMELTGGKFEQNLAFSHWETQTSHIALQPECSDETLVRIALPMPTRRLIAHEATHLVRYATLPNFRSHPHWFADGMATWVAEKVMIAGGWSAGAERDPHLSTMIVRAAALLRKGEMPAANRILEDDLEDVPWRTRYALRWLVFRFLEQSMDHESFRAVMGEARQLGGGANYGRRLKAFILDSLGPERMKSFDRRFANYLQDLEPRWEEIYPSLATAGDEWAQVAYPTKNAIAWRTDPVGRSTYALEGKLKILPNSKQQMNVLLGRNVDGFVSVALSTGGVTVFNYLQKENRWHRLGYRDATALRGERWVLCRVEIADDRLSVSLNSETVLSVSLNGRPMQGSWGLGAQAGSAGIWGDVRLD